MRAPAALHLQTNCTILATQHILTTCADFFWEEEHQSRMASVTMRRGNGGLVLSLWRGLEHVKTAAVRQRSLQTSCDDRDIGSNVFDRHVRIYDKKGKLSRHMNPDIDEMILKFENALGLPPLMTKEWEKYQPAASKIVTLKTQRFANYVGSETNSRLLSRKVSVWSSVLDQCEHADSEKHTFLMKMTNLNSRRWRRNFLRGSWVWVKKR
jgi:hypothetical protein